MSAPATRLDFAPPFLDMSGAIHDLASLSAIAVMVVQNSIVACPPEYAGLNGKKMGGHVVVILTQEQFSNLHFICEHIRDFAEKARNSLEAVENLIVEDAR